MDCFLPSQQCLFVYWSLEGRGESRYLVGSGQYESHTPWVGILQLEELPVFSYCMTCMSSQKPYKPSWHLDVKGVSVNFSVFPLAYSKTCRSNWPHGLRPIAGWYCEFEPRRIHGCLSFVSVVCCQVEVSASGWSLVQGSPTECVCVCVWVWLWRLDNLEALAHWDMSYHGKNIQSCRAKLWSGIGNNAIVSILMYGPGTWCSNTCSKVKFVSVLSTFVRPYILKITWSITRINM